MKAILQRVSEASVTVDGEVVGEIGKGLLILFCALQGDGDNEFEALISKLIGLRIFNDQEGKMNQSCEDIGGDYLVVSQFTLAANTKKGKRPSYVAAMEPNGAEAMFIRFCDELARRSGRRVERGVFGADMKVALVNEGPVTIALDFPPQESACANA